MTTKEMAKMGQRNFIYSWLLPCSLRSHRIANPPPKNGLRHFSALPTHHPNTHENKLYNVQKICISNFFVLLRQNY